MQERNTGFDLLHKNFDFRINGAIRNTTQALRVLQAQLLSRVGFVTDEIRERQEYYRDEITAHGIRIGDPERECVLQARQALDNAAEYAGYSMTGIVGEAMYYINQIEHDYFFPYINVLQLESNVIQWTVLSEFRRANPVTNTANLVQRLDDDYMVILALYQSAIQNIPREMLRIEDHMNEVKMSMFPQLNSVRDYFSFTAAAITGELPLCGAESA